MSSSPRIEARPAWVTLLIGALAATCVGLVAILALGLTAAWATSVVVAGAAVLCFGRAVYDVADRSAWVAFGTSGTLMLAGSAYAATLSNATTASLADALSLAAYVPAYIGIVLLTRSRLDHVEISRWSDGVIGALAIAAGAAATVLDPVLGDAALRAPRESFATILTNLAYPVGDLVLLAFAIATVGFLGWRPGRAIAMVALAFGLLAVADIAYLLQSLDGTVETGVVTAVWPIATLLIGAAAWEPGPLASPAAARGRLTDQIAMLAFSGIVTCILLIGLIRPLNIVAQALAVAATLAVMARLVIAARESQQLERSRFEAHTDDLTGLANRRGFYGVADEALTTAEAKGEGVALMMIDLDRFKEINDSLGHGAGDQLLEVVAERISSCMPKGALVGRLGGDEFIVLITGTTGNEALQVARAIRRSLNAPVQLAGIACYTSVSIGIAIGPEHSYDRITLMSRADVAMYQAKRSGSGVEAFNSDDTGMSRNQIELASELRGAAERGELVLYYQPKADMRSGCLDGVEALLRWAHPRHGVLAPDTFLPLAEAHGLMREMSMAVLQMALAQQAEWRRCGYMIPVAVNLSPVDLLDTAFPGEVAALIARFETPVRTLELEITENTVMVDPDRILEVLAQLRGLGVALALDDYGTGHSSLTYLKQLPVTTLKIDRSFVSDMTAANDNATIVRSTIELAQNLGMRVVAEGVETHQHWEQLASYGCDMVQGYYLSRPLPAGDLIEWMTRATTAPEAQAA